jgi:putative membrane protein
MSLLHRTHTPPHAEPTPESPDTVISATAEDVTQRAPSWHVPRTRTGTAWVGVSAAAVIAVALIVFLAQNTRSTEISFLWMTTSTSLTVALLIAAVGSVLLTLIIGTARITQLRRLLRRRRL